MWPERCLHGCSIGHRFATNRSSQGEIQAPLGCYPGGWQRAQGLSPCAQGQKSSASCSGSYLLATYTSGGVPHSWDFPMQPKASWDLLQKWDSPWMHGESEFPQSWHCSGTCREPGAEQHQDPESSPSPVAPWN